MGAWGDQPFDNDAALDWVRDELEPKGARAVRAALRTAARAPPGACLDIDDGAWALAAAELVSAALGFGRDRLPPNVAAWLDTHPTALTPKDAALARSAVERVFQARSEWFDVWTESGPLPKAMQEIATRLGATVAPPKPRARSLPLEHAWKTQLIEYLRSRGLEPGPAQIARIESAGTSEGLVWLALAGRASSVEALLATRPKRSK